ncbi:MAG: agmatine deiminase family protein [Desulfobacterales bacterium]|nr:agmatine deiminase family protein [Desulfobacterales bacterium]
MALCLSGSALAGTKRVPAEWEAHAATWMQWPGVWDAGMRGAFADIIAVIQDYEPVHLIVRDAAEQREADAFLSGEEVPLENVTFHRVPKENAWLRDNGPIYVVEDGRLIVQNWGFDAWGGNFGEDVGFRKDDRVPEYIGGYLGMPVVDRTDYILEKGNLEFNGAGILVVNWDCQDDRNPGMIKATHEEILRDAFGVDRIIWAYGHHPDDGTTGHIDGIARFIDTDVIVIADTGEDTELDLAAACRAEGLTVQFYPGDPNWLVGNGFVAAMGEGGPEDAELKSYLESFFPDRDVYMIDARTIADAGGGIHCVTNDQPRMK